MSLPESGDETVTTATRKWRTDVVRIERRADGISVTVVDRMIQDGKVTSVVRTRELTDEEADALWGATNTLTFKAWVVNQILPNAE